MLRPLALALAFAVVACSAESASEAPAAGSPASEPPAPLVCTAGSRDEGGRCVEAGLDGCADGFARSGLACAPTFASRCDAGGAPMLGASGCTPLGHRACGPRFAPRDGSWGCAPAVPSTACAGNTFPALGSATCAPLSACLASPPSGATLFVDQSLPPGAVDETHVRTVTDALARAAAGQTVFVSAGTYSEAIEIARGVRVVGACAGTVVLASPEGSLEPTVRFGGSGGSLEGVTVAGGSVAIDVGGASATLRGVAIERASTTALSVAAGTLVAERLAIRETGAGSAEGVAVRALGGQLSLTDVSVAQTRGTGLSLRRGAKVAMTRVVVESTRAITAGTYGWALDVESGAAVTGSDVAVRGASFAALAATDGGTSVTLKGVTLEEISRGSVGSGSPRLGVALAATEGARVTLESATLADSAGAGVLVAGGATVTLRDATVEGAGPLGDAGGGAYAAGGSLELEATVIRGAAPHGIFASDASSVTVDTVAVADTASTGDTSSGIGVLVSASTLEGRRLTIERTRTAQLALIDGAKASLSELAVRDAAEGDSDNFAATGIGLLLDQGSSATIRRAFVGGSRMMGISLRRASKLVAEDLVLDTVVPAAREGGYGMLAIEASEAKLTRFALMGTRGAAIVAGEAGTKVILDRGVIGDVTNDERARSARGFSVQRGASLDAAAVRVVDTQSSALYAVDAGTRVAFRASIIDGVSPAPNGLYGDGLELVDGVVLTLASTRVSRARGAALVFAAASGVIDRSVIADNAVGLHVQDGSYLDETDAAPSVPERGAVVLTATELSGNETKIGQGVLPLPDPLPLP